MVTCIEESNSFPQHTADLDLKASGYRWNLTVLAVVGVLLVLPVPFESRCRQIIERDRKMKHADNVRP